MCASRIGDNRIAFRGVYIGDYANSSYRHKRYDAVHAEQFSSTLRIGKQVMDTNVLRGEIVHSISKKAFALFKKATAHKHPAAQSILDRMMDSLCQAEVRTV